MPDNLGRYRIPELIGGGGMGGVFLADDARPSRKVRALGFEVAIDRALASVRAE